MVAICVDPDDFSTDNNGRLVIKKGCGMKGSDDGVAANVATWADNFTCDQDDNATPIYCNPTTGQLQGIPFPKTIQDQSFETRTTVPDAIPPDGLSIFVGNADQDIILPGCYNYDLQLISGFTLDISIQGTGDGFDLDIRQTFDGDITADFRNVWGVRNNPGPQRLAQRDEYRTVTFIRNVAPGVHSMATLLRITPLNNTANLRIENETAFMTWIATPVFP